MKAVPGIALLLAACAAAPPPDDELPVRQPVDSCKSAPGQAFVGRTASAETAGRLLAATGATRLRWVPPRTAVTMDYAFGRVTVSYDDAYIITRVSCG